MTDDPCDEWPRALVLKAVGLRSCGHPKGPGLCLKCMVEAQNARSFASTLARAPQICFETPGPLCGAKVERAPGSDDVFG